MTYGGSNSDAHAEMHVLCPSLRSGHPDSNRESLAPKASMLAVTPCPEISIVARFIIKSRLRALLRVNVALLC